MAIKHVLVTLWDRDTRLSASRFPDDPNVLIWAQNRMLCLEYMTQQAEERWPAWSAVHNNSREFDYHLVVAPEYLFAKAGNRPFLEEAQKESIRAIAVNIAARNPKLILVPGSVVWRKSMLRPNSRLHKRGTQDAKPGGAVRDFTRYDEINTRSLNYLQMTRQTFDRTLYSKSRQPSFEQINTWSQQPPQANRYIGRNTAYVFWENNVHTHHKAFENIGMTGVEEASINVDWSDTLFMPGRLAPVPQVHGMSFGLEVCAEHAFKPALMLSGKQCHFHLIVSASIQFVPGKGAAKNGGFIVHADSSDSAVYGIDDLGVAQKQQPIYQFGMMDAGLNAGEAVSYLCVVDV